ncbi:Imidazolonepropionase [Nakamurella panacisegetis]|uniref:Imidazolonepropionase n=1 Tax=Nakamurella panacisegetis TaxID=1090615 RepID=A0A1H0P9T5_9ACTN|nr:amidohydrolase family protein [Nakamurella panacisegetis]SDP01386.1 Imidazolonepropionase [Nakamurella panacisegetis]
MTSLDSVAVFDGVSDLGARSLSWTGDSITAVGEPTGEAQYSVIPGLVDTHVHLLGYAGGRSNVRGFDTFTWPLVTIREEQTLHATANAQKAMRLGVTTLRDLGADETQAAIGRVFDAGILPGPRLLASGPVGMTAGHLDLFTPRAVTDRPPTADSPDACRALVRRWARAGLTGIKTYTSGGVLSMGDKVAWRNHTRAEIAATVDEAHALGMLVACHTHSAEGIQIALDEGMDSIEHGTGMTLDQAAVLARRGIPVAPTLLINDMIARAEVPVSDEAQSIAAALVSARDELLRGAAQAGVRFVLGTDANGYFLEFGDQWRELVRMVEVLGHSPAQALRAATSDAASAVGLGTSVGTIAPGFGADFLVMKGRPWQDVSLLDPDNIVAVVCRGQVVAGALPA